MFVGHYGVSFAAKRFAPRTSLGTLFVVVQLLDVLFAIFVLMGIEKLRIVPGFTEYNSYDLYYMPYSHGLVGALAWSCVAALAFVPLRGRPVALWIGAAVFSHFLLDVPMHTRDLPILGNDSLKIGFGLWRHRYIALGAELLALGAGLWIYRRTAPKASERPRHIVFVLFLVVLTVATPFLPPPADGSAFAVQALASYFALAALAAWIDRRAVP